MVPEPLATILSLYFEVNSFTADWPASLQSYLNDPASKERERLFRTQLAEAILHDTVTPQDYEKLTREDFDTPEDLRRWLKEVWRDLYGDRPITLDQ
jgi:hypothetical protein